MLEGASGFGRGIESSIGKFGNACLVADLSHRFIGLGCDCCELDSSSHRIIISECCSFRGALDLGIWSCLVAVRIANFWSSESFGFGALRTWLCLVNLGHFVKVTGDHGDATRYGSIRPTKYLLQRSNGSPSRRCR